MTKNMMGIWYEDKSEARCLRVLVYPRRLCRPHSFYPDQEREFSITPHPSRLIIETLCFPYNPYTKGFLVFLVHAIEVFVLGFV